MKKNRPFNKAFLKTLAVTITVITVLASCRSKNSEYQLNGTNVNIVGLSNFKVNNTGIKTINIPDRIDNFKVDSMINIQTVKYVALETNPSYFIGRIDKLLVLDKQFIILDRLSKSVFIYSDEGKFISKISHVGHGPKEYISIRDVAVDPEKKAVLLYDDFTNKILSYDYKGVFIGVKKIGIRFRNFRALKNGEYLLGVLNSPNDQLPEINRYSILILSNLDKIKAKGFVNSEALMSNPYIQEEHFSNFQKETIFSPRLTDSIYSISQTGLVTAKYFLNYSNKLPKNFLDSKENNKHFEQIAADKYTYFMGVFKENLTHLFLRINPPTGNYKLCFYNKKTNKTATFNKFTRSNPNLLGFSQPIASKDSCFYEILSASSIAAQKKYLPNNIKTMTRGNIKLVNSIKENDNPVIMIYSLK